jgi:putative transposase
MTTMIPRRFLYFKEGYYYHIAHYKKEEELLFSIPSHYSIFFKFWQKYAAPFLDMYAYCLLPDRFECVVKVKPVDNIVKKAIIMTDTQHAIEYLVKRVEYDAFIREQLNNLLDDYETHNNPQFDVNWWFFEKRYRWREVGSMDIFKESIAYIHHCPIQLGHAITLDEWRYSSYNTYLSDKPTNILREEGLSWFDVKRQVAPFVKYHEDFAEKWQPIVWR